MKLIIITIVTIIIILTLWQIYKYQNIKYAPLPIPIIDLNRYSGLWYEIARLPNYFENGCTRATATYSLNKDNTISVTNRCTNNNNVTSSINGVAYGNQSLPPTHQLGQLQVYFKNIPFPGEYNIIYIDSNYENAMVGTYDRQKLWLLSRFQSPPATKLKDMMNLAKIFGYNVDNLVYNIYMAK